jgi:uncharacterized protein (DUF58 family)
VTRALTTTSEQAPLVSMADITAIELLILRRMTDVTLGNHRSRSYGTGFDLIGLRDWQTGDKFSSIDWAQSSLSNFAPMVVREFEQLSTATVVAIADVSLSTRCGVNGVQIATAMARAVATIGLSAAFFQDPFGLITFDANFEHLAAIRPRTGKGHIVHCVDAYQYQQGLVEMTRIGGVGNTLAGYLRRKSMLPIISDFLFDDPETILKELAFLNARHDVFIVLIDSAFAFELPNVSAGWVETVDVETGRTRTLSRQALKQMAERVRDWQARVHKQAKDLDLDVVEIGLDQGKSDLALSEFVAERRLRKLYN